MYIDLGAQNTTERQFNSVLQEGSNKRHTSELFAVYFKTAAVRPASELHAQLDWHFTARHAKAKTTSYSRYKRSGQSSTEYNSDWGPPLTSREWSLGDSK